MAWTKSPESIIVDCFVTEDDVRTIVAILPAGAEYRGKKLNKRAFILAGKKGGEFRMSLPDRFQFSSDVVADGTWGFTGGWLSNQFVKPMLWHQA